MGLAAERLEQDGGEARRWSPRLVAPVVAAPPPVCNCGTRGRGYEPALWVAERDGQVRVPVAQIRRIEAAKDYAIIHTGARRYILRITMSDLEAKLDPAVVMRVHRSAFVRLEAVRRVTWSGRSVMQLHTEDGATIDVGPTYAKQVAAALGL